MVTAKTQTSRFRANVRQVQLFLIKPSQTGDKLNLELHVAQSDFHTNICQVGVQSLTNIDQVLSKTVVELHRPVPAD